MILKRLCAALLAAGLVSGLSGAAHAQSATATPPAADKSDTVGKTQGNTSTDAKTKDDTTPGVERVEVTGSAIKRINTETASPLQIISHQQIVDEGANTLAEVLAKLPSAMPGLVDSNSVFTGTDGASYANLRGLGPQATLILLNGRRLSSYGAPSGFQYQFVNIDAIPVDAIERIEVLTDGASAIYGSDAIAGVINIITKTSYQGLELRGSAQESMRTNSNGEYQSAISYGFGDLATDHFNIFGTLSLYKRDAVELPTVINDFPAPYYAANPNFLNNFHTANGSQPGVLNPGSLFTYDAAGNYHSVAAPGCTTIYTVGQNTSCALNTLPLGQFVVPSSDRDNLFVSAHYDFNPDWHGFTELSATHIDMFAPTSPNTFYSGSSWQWYARNTGFTLQTFAPAYLAAGNPYNTLPPSMAAMMNGVAGLNYTFLDNNKIFHQENRDDEYRLLTGISGTIGTWDVETALAIAGTHSVLNQDTNPSVSGFAAAFGPFTVDPKTGLTVMSNHPAYQFGVWNASNAALLAQMYPDNMYPSWDKIATWDGKISGKLFDIPAGEVKGALGFNVNHEDFYSPGNPSAANGDVAWQGGSWFSGQRTTEAIYAEALAPLTSKLELDAAMRADKYPDFPLHVVPKLGLKFTVSPQLMLRTTFSEGFRAPSLAESGTGGVYAQTFVDDPIRCGETNAIANLLRKSNVPSDVLLGQSLQNSDCSTIVGGVTVPNPELKPETAKIGTTGLVFQPNKNFDISADYFIISRRNEIVPVSPNQVLMEAEAADGPSPNGVPGSFARLPVTLADKGNEAALVSMCQNPLNAGLCPATLPNYTVGDVSGILTGYINRGKTLIDGFDIDANSHFNLGEYGRFNAGMQATIKTRFLYITPQGDWGANNVGLYGTPRVTAVMKASWDYNNFVTSLIGNYTGPQSLWNGTGDTTWDYTDCVANGLASPAVCSKGVGSSTYWTANLNWKHDKKFNLDLNIQNVFNRRPHYDPEGTYGVNQYENYLGVVVNVSGRYKF